LEVANGTNLHQTGDIQTQYDANPNILYVQLVGDWANLRSALLNSVTSTIGSQDPMLGCVVGLDQYIDVMVGRFSVQSSADVATQINKAINYEKNPQIGASWYDTALGIARYEGDGGGDDGEADDQHQEYVRNRLLSFNYTTVNREYDNNSAFVTLNATSGSISSVINSGVSIINYTNHGNETGWSVGDYNNADVSSLTNGDKLPFIMSVACLVGKTSYSGGDCFAETWLKKSGGGAVVGMFSSISQPWTPPMCGQDYFNDILIGGYDYSSNPGSGITTNEQRTHFGAIAFNATNLMLEENPMDAATRDTQEAWNIFGDVTLQVRTDQPILIDNASTVLFQGNYSTTITSGGSPIEGARVTLYQAGVNVTRLTNVAGNVSIDHGFAVGTSVTLTVTGFNLETEQSTLLVNEVDSGGIFAIDTTNLDYGNISSGNNSVKQFVISNAHGIEHILGDITTITGYTVLAAVKGDVKNVRYIKSTVDYSVAPGSNKTFNLTFAPIAGGSYNGNIIITSSDTNHATEYIAVTGTGIVPDINLNPTSLMATARPDNFVDESFDIENTDLGTLNYSMSINYTGGKEIKAFGGPDTYGYKWKDSDEVGGPVYDWVDISLVGTDLGFTKMDENRADIPIGFDFEFYGNTYSTLNVCTNGFLSFTSASFIYENTPIPYDVDPNNIIAPYWDDLDITTSPEGAVYTYHDIANNRFIIEWYKMVNWGITAPNTFQVILYEDGTIIFQYEDIQGYQNSCTIGIENIDGDDGTLVVFNSTYLTHQIAIEFELAPEWLSLDSSTGSVVGFGSDTITATCDATNLEVGVYTADIIIASNDMDEATKVLPVTFTVANAGVYVENPIADRTYIPTDVEIIDISNVFVDSEGDPLTLTIESNSNPAVIDVSLVGSTLTLTASSLLFGSSTIVLKGEDIAHGESATYSFNVTIDTNQPYIVWDFESGLQGWTIGGTATSWQYYNAKGIPSSGSKFLFIDSDAQGEGMNVKGNAISPIVDLSAYSSGA
ncbi:MAG: hypothetical protein GQ534_01410, partial [Candidatus Delongbacteria bacterium]|nr:hypothetical protein [Candidatus Delongbacteria bacterium]